MAPPPENLRQSLQWQAPTPSTGPSILYRTAPQAHPPFRSIIHPFVLAGGYGPIIPLLPPLWQQPDSRTTSIRRAERLFQIIQILRARRSAVTGRQLAEELGISLRSLYRDMAELVAQHVPVRGEAGTGYVLDEGYDLPPLMLTADELEAAMLGAAWVAKRGDPALAQGARDLIAKIVQVVPASVRPALLDETLKPISLKPVAPERLDMAVVRRALRDRVRLAIAYQDGDGTSSERTIWPIFLAYMEEVRIIVAWCELRQDFRHFRTDRVHAMTIMTEGIPERQNTLLKRWKATQLRSRT